MRRLISRMEGRGVTAEAGWDFLSSLRDARARPATVQLYCATLRGLMKLLGSEVRGGARGRRAHTIQAPMGTWRYILHADLDAFYASVEQRDNPALKGKPVVVGGSPDERGVVAAASYEARKHGIHSAMPMTTALRLCPTVVRVPPRFDRYREVSRQIMGLFTALTPVIQPLSLDEAYLDVSTEVTPDSVEDVARRLKGQVKQETSLTITIGGGVTKTIAKIASRKAKPDGLMLIRPGEEHAFLDPLPADLLWGVGPKTKEALDAMGLSTIGAIAQADDQVLRAALGSRGWELKRRALVLDDDPVEVDRETKSISAEDTFPRDIADPSQLAGYLRRQADTVASHLTKEGLKARTVRLKLRLADFTTFTRQATLAVPTDDARTIIGVARELLRREITPGRRFRLIGLGVANFQESYQTALLPQEDPGPG